MEQIIHRQEAELVLEDNGAVIGREIEEEIKNKLEEGENGHRIVSVSFSRDKVTVKFSFSWSKLTLTIL